MDRIFWAMPKAVFTVMMLWYVLSLFFSGQDFMLAGERLVYALLSVLVAFAGGWLIWIVFYVGVYKEHLMEALESSEIKEVRLNLYTSNNKKKNRILHPRIPMPLDVLPTAKVDQEILSQWNGYTAYKKQHPNHAKVFESIFRTLTYYRYLPATHHPEGHGGFSLLEHSMNVVRLMDKIGGNFKYFGVYHKNKLIIPMREPESLKRGFYQVKKGDPLLPIMALAHDLGKIEAFKPIKADGSIKKFMSYLTFWKKPEMVKVERVFDAHDLLGKKLLLKIHDIYLLNWQERNDLMNAVGYHHHYDKAAELEDYVIQGLPYSNVTSDRQHALAALMDYIDTQASFLEGGGRIKPFFIPPGMQKTSGIPEQNDDINETSSEDGPERPYSEGLSEPQNSSGTQPVQSPQDTINSDTAAPEGAVFKWLCELVRQEGKSQRGNSRINRLNGWIYLDEIHWRNWLFKREKPVQEPEALTLQSPVITHPVTMELLGIIIDKDGMPKDFELQNNLPKLFTVSVERANGNPYIREKVIVFKESLMPFKIGIRKSSRPITIVEQTGLSAQNSTTQESVNNQQNVNVPPQEKEPVPTKQTGASEKSTVAEEKKNTDHEGKPTDAQIKHNVDAFIEWVTLVQNWEFPNEDPFPEKKSKGRPYAIVDILRIPKHFLEAGPLIGADDRLELNAEDRCVIVPIQLRKRMRS